MKHLLVALLPLAPLGLASSRGLPLPSCMLLFEPAQEVTTPLKMGLLSRKIPPCVSGGRTFCQLRKHRRIAFENEIYCWQEDQFKW